MKTVNIHEAKTHLSRLIEDVAGGGEVIIARNGKPVARLLPITHRAHPRRPGQWRGRVQIADDFDAPLPVPLAAAFGTAE
ncbi:MAG: type II toxin-antitoxin system Phd/YefM family antitoxin [Defluviicoccus sp.]|nr:MAG: type II toxin-antitoxin system Phd/YefM family antitoxin [Defluviicoccus sp.]